ncbi:MAG TPA: hypothetical protein VGV18_00240 [Verrucomicrobiae bacterium]|nr:hypothetical protein [Verrucomicrobiae bacterium]
MSFKTINWTKWASISFVATFVFAGLGWSIDKAIVYGPLPGQVSDHERRITALESANATNSIVLNDRLNDLDRDLQRIFKRLDQISAMSDASAMSATNRNSVGER